MRSPVSRSISCVVIAFGLWTSAQSASAQFIRDNVKVMRPKVPSDIDDTTYISAVSAQPDQAAVERALLKKLASLLERLRKATTFEINSWRQGPKGLIKVQLFYTRAKAEKGLIFYPDKSTADSITYLGTTTEVILKTVAIKGRLNDLRRFGAVDTAQDYSADASWRANADDGYRAAFRLMSRAMADGLTRFCTIKFTARNEYNGGDKYEVTYNPVNEGGLIFVRCNEEWTDSAFVEVSPGTMRTLGANSGTLIDLKGYGAIEVPLKSPPRVGPLPTSGMLVRYYATTRRYPYFDVSVGVEAYIGYRGAPAQAEPTVLRTLVRLMHDYPQRICFSVCWECDGPKQEKFRMRAVAWRDGTLWVRNETVGNYAGSNGESGVNRFTYERTLPLWLTAQTGGRFRDLSRYGAIEQRNQVRIELGIRKDYDDGIRASIRVLARKLNLNPPSLEYKLIFRYLDPDFDQRRIYVTYRPGYDNTLGVVLGNFDDGEYGDQYFGVYPKVIQETAKISGNMEDMKKFGARLGAQRGME